MPWQILRFNKFFMSLGWHRHGSATNVPQGVHLPYEWIVVLNSCNLFRFAGLHTIGGFWSRLAIQQLEDPQINMFLKEMQNNPREAQKQMMSDRAGCAFGAWRLDVWERLQVSWGVVI